MGIVNRRNAVLGWAVWQVGKRVAKTEGEDGRPDADARRRRESRTRRRSSRRSPRPAGVPRVFWRRKKATATDSPTAPSSERRPGFFRRSIAELVPYEPGKPVEEVQRELGLDRVVKLASNEGPFGPFPAALEALERSAPS